MHRKFGAIFATISFFVPAQTLWAAERVVRGAAGNRLDSGPWVIAFLALTGVVVLVRRAILLRRKG